MDYQERLHQFFSVCSGKVSDVFYELYDIIISFDNEEQPLAVRYACENVFNVESDSTYRIEKRYYSLEQYRKAVDIARKKFEPILNDLIQNSIRDSVDEDTFYRKVWTIIQNNKMFKTKRDRAYALFVLADNSLVPYRNVGTGISMENDEYRKIIDSFDASAILDTRYILKTSYDQRTQRASLLLDKLLALESKEERTVYFSIVLEELEDTLKGKMKEAIDNL